MYTPLNVNGKENDKTVKKTGPVVRTREFLEINQMYTFLIYTTAGEAFLTYFIRLSVFFFYSYKARYNNKHQRCFLVVQGRQFFDFSNFIFFLTVGNSRRIKSGYENNYAITVFAEFS